MQRLVRWAGGKKWFIPHFNNITNNLNYNNYYEPFAGGATIFFSCIDGHQSFLSDLNEELICAYRVIKEKPEQLCRLLNNMEVSENDYYYYRDEFICADEDERAARFLYLNHFSFNGIYRVNKDGKYNVPYGKRELPYNTNIIYIAHEKLQRTNLAVGDFNIWAENINEGDLVFLDPPYSVSSKKSENGFIEYNSKLFSLDDQKRLKCFIDLIKERHAYYILTNAYHETIHDIFAEETDVCIDLNRSCVIGGRNATRGRVNEYIFTNIARDKWGGR